MAKKKSPNFGLYACSELKYCSILYVVLEKSLLLVEKAFLANLGLFSFMAAKTPDLTVKNGIFLTKV